MRDVALALSGVVSGAALAWIFTRTANLTALGAIGRRIVAHLLEFRLFFDEPALILRAQADLIRENLQLLRALVVPMLAAGLPFALLLLPLESVFGVSPLVVGEPALITVSLTDPPSADGVGPTLEAPPGIRVDAGPVRIPSERRVCWRILAGRPSSGDLRVTINGRTMERPVSAGIRPLLLRIRQNGVEVDYPRNSWMGLFLLWSAASAGVCAWIISSRS